MEFYKKFYKEDINELNKLKVKEVGYLILFFEEEEIKRIVWLCEGLKVLGFVGFDFNFIKKVWEYIKYDICKEV